MAVTTSTAYRYDAHGHYMGAETVMTDPMSGELMLPPDCTTIAPDESKLSTCWAVLNEKKTKWTYEKKPTTAAECIGISVKHDDQCPWAYEMKELFETLTAADADHYRVVRDDDLTQTVEAIPEKTLEELRTEKLNTLSSEASRYQAWNCKDMYITSSLGFAVNSDQCSQNNMQQLINLLPDDVTTTSFKIYDNTFKALTRVDLNTLLQESVQAGLQMYATKFALQAKIAAATSKTELDAIEIKFEMVDFTADKTDE